MLCLQAQCRHLPVATVQRYQLLQAAVDMLPEGVQAAHAEELFSRHYQEQLEPQVLRQVRQGSSLGNKQSSIFHSPWNATPL